MATGRWVMFDGLPGAGKTTLAADLAQHLAASDTGVDLVTEEDLFVRPEFREAAQSSRRPRTATADAPVTAYTRVARRAIDCGHWLIFDWDVAGMAEDLE